MDDREREAPDRHDLIADGGVLRVEEQDEKFFMRPSIEVSSEKATHLTRL
jgi:hypothetical protein